MSDRRSEWLERVKERADGGRSGAVAERVTGQEKER